MIYDLLMKASAETTLTIAADPKHLGARIGIIAVLHTWGSALTHHPHVHMIVPGGGLSPDGSRWIASRPGFLLHVNVLSRLFRGRFLAMLAKAHTQGQLKFFGEHAALADDEAFKRLPGAAAQRANGWSTPSDPFAGPQAGAALSLPLHPPRRHLQSPSRSRPMTRVSPSAGRTTASRGPAAGRR